jgi:aquaporin Z
MDLHNTQNIHRCVAEGTGTFWLTSAGCGSAVIAAAFADVGIGLTLIHLVGIPISNTSVNPARSTGPALFAGGWALAQLWMFWVAPLVGGALGGILYRWLSEEPSAQVTGIAPAAPAE